MLPSGLDVTFMIHQPLDETIVHDDEEEDVVEDNEHDEIVEKVNDEPDCTE